MKNRVRPYLCLLTIFFLNPIALAEDGKNSVVVQPRLSSKLMTEKSKAQMEAVRPVLDELLKQAVLNIEAGIDQKAEALLNSAMEIAPYDTRAYIYSGQLYIRQKNELFFLRLLEHASRSPTDLDFIFLNLPAVAKSALKPHPFHNAFIYIAPFKGDAKTAFSFNFDDGPVSVYEKALPIFEKYGYHATILINPRIVDLAGEDSVSWGSWQQWKDADRRGFEIGNHGMNHRPLTALTSEELEFEVNAGYEKIRQNIGKPPMSFIFPENKSDERSLIKVLERHPVVRQREALTGVYPDIFIPALGGEFLSLDGGQRLVDYARAQRLWVIPECHAMVSSVNTYKPMRIEFLDGLLSYVQKAGDVWVDTFLNVYAYRATVRKSNLTILEQRTDEILFDLKAAVQRPFLNQPLTVVWNNGWRKDVQAHAVYESSKQAIPVLVKNDTVQINVLPNQGPVRVWWK